VIIGTILMLLIPVVIVIIVLRHRRDMATQRYKTILDLVEKGAPLPTELLLESPGKRGHRDLRSGLVLSFAGIGAIAFAFTLPEHQEWGVGLLPLFVGLGYLVTWLMTRTDGSPGGDA
jgi:hypothetical protein